MLLIGPGGNGDGSSGGGSGAVTVWYGAAQHVPNSLVVVVGAAGVGPTSVSARFSNSAATPTALLQANRAVGATAATASTANQFAASGFYKSTAGQNGGAGSVAANDTTFLSGGCANTGEITANYGYTLSNSTSSLAGMFQMQPIIVGLGSKGGRNGAIGCGGGTSGSGGPGMVLIASW
jgi:hypothetical protein